MGDSGGTSHSNSMQSYTSPSSTSLLAQAVAPSGAVLAIMFTIWYGFNAAYNVYNAATKKVFPFPLAIAASQVSVYECVWHS